MGTKHVNSAAKSEQPMESPLKRIYEPDLSLPIEDILLKHLDGVEAILESEPNFEQTQGFELETFRPTRDPSPQPESPVLPKR